MPGKKGRGGQSRRKQGSGRGMQGRGRFMGSGPKSVRTFTGPVIPVNPESKTDSLSPGRIAAVAEVNPVLCAGCGRCVPICPAGAIKMIDTAIIDKSMCTGCGRCVPECPLQAISLH